MPVESILVSADWETGDVFQGVFSPSSLAFPSGYSASIDNSVARLGSKSCRFELRSSDPIVGGSKRAELSLFTANPINPALRWFAWSEFLPADYVSDSLNELHFQIHSTGSITGPNVALWLRNNRWYVNQKYNNAGSNIEVQTEIGGNSAAKLGGWDDWVLQFVPSISGDGILRLWRNQVLVFESIGPNANNAGGSLEAVRYPKFGVYKWPWSNPGVYYPNTRVVWFDQIKFGNDSATLSDFAITDPPTTPPAEPGGATAVEGFVFIPG